MKYKNYLKFILFHASELPSQLAGVVATGSAKPPLD